MTRRRTSFVEIHVGSIVKAVALVFASVAAVALVLAAGGDGQIGPFSQDIAARGLASWMWYSTANTLGATTLVVATSTLIGLPLGLFASNQRRATLPRWLEVVSALPAFVLTALWLTNTPRAPLLVLCVCVGVQRAFQVGGLVVRAERSRLLAQGVSLYPVADLRLATLGRWQPFLWVSAAHTSVVFAAEHAALVLLGFVSPAPSTWVGTLCAAAMGAAEVDVFALGFAALGLLTLPGALWSQARGKAQAAA